MNTEHRISKVERRTVGHWLARSTLGVLAAGMMLSVSGAPETNTVPSLNSFQIIGTRNIFDPNRYRRETFQRPTTRQRVDAFALVGTMSYSKGQFAFFDGSNSQYKKVVEPGGTISGYTVKEITQDAVTLAANGKDFQMKVGAQMRNEGNNKWTLSGHIIDDTPTDEANGDTNGENAAADSSAPPTGANSEANDVLKQMMLRRQQELK